MKWITLLLLILNVIICEAQTPVIKWWFDTHDSSFGQSAMDDLDGDDTLDVVFGCYRNDSMVYALNGADGSLLWKYNTATSAEGCNDVAMLIYDVDDNGTNEVVVPSSCNPTTFCFNGADGTIKWASPSAGSDSPPVIADLDNDNIPEIIHGEFGGTVRSYNAETGAENWNITVDDNSWIQTAPSTNDLDGNGQMDFVVATWNFSDNNKVYAYNGADNSLMWSYPLTDVVYHGTSIADINKDGISELVIGDYSGTLTVLKPDGTLLWNYSASGYIGSPVSIGDIDGDDWCDLVFCAGSEIIALNYDGSEKWIYGLSGYNTAFRGVVLCDMNNDSKKDVVFATSGGEVIAVNGTSGTNIWSIDLQSHYGYPFAIDHAPVIGDMDSDGYLDVFVIGGHTEYPDFSVNYGRAYALSTSQPASPENTWLMFQHDVQRHSSVCEDYSAVHENVHTNVLHVYPNPVNNSEELTITTNPYNQFNKIKVTDITGKIIFTKDIPLTDRISVNTSSFSTGIYFVEITVADSTYVHKVSIN